MGAPLAAVVALAAAAVSVRTNKGIVIPGADASAELLVVAHDAPPDAKVEITATAGKVQDVRALGDGRYQATWVPPQGAPPAMAFIAARVWSGEEVELGLAAIAVHGATRVEADVAPRAKVTVDAGGRSFGPFTADAGGHLRAQVMVPPRLKEVTLRTDAGERAVPLELPPVSLLYLAAVAPPGGPPSRGHGEESLEVLILSVDRSGYPAWKPPPKLAASAGDVAPQGLAAPGVFRWTWEAPESPSSGEAKLTATLAGDPASVASLAVTLRPPRPEAVAKRDGPRGPAEAPGGPATPLALRLSTKRIVSGEDNSLVVEVSRGGRVLTPAELAAVSIESDVGTLIPAAGGVRWVFPSSFGGRAGAVIRASIDGATAEERVALAPGPPAVGRIAFDAPRARGGRPVGARLTLTDAHHNAVSGAQVAVRAPKGEASAAVEEPGGIYRFSYTPPDVERPETEQVEVEVEGGLIVPAPPLPVTPRLAGLGVSVGVAMALHSNTVLASGVTPAAELDVRLPSKPLEIVLRVDRSFYQPVDQVLSLQAPSSRTVTFGSLGVELGVRGELSIRPWLGLYGAVGVLGRRTEARSVVHGGFADGATETSSGLCAGVEAAVGVTQRLGVARFLVEGFYALVPGRGALRGNLGGWGVRGTLLLEVL